MAQKRNVIGILPTGFGKSLIFQFAAESTERLLVSCLETVAQKRNVIGILPTGFGKSLIFQFAAESTERLVETRPCL